MLIATKDLIEYYKRDNFYDIQTLNPLVLQYTEGIRGKALDLGAGTGANSQYLSNKGFDVTALEVNPKAVRMIKELRINVRCEDIRKIRWSKEGYYNVILCLYVFQHLKDNDIFKIIEEMKYSLEKKGMIIISSFKTTNNSFSLRTLDNLFCLDKSFKIISKESWQRLDLSHNIPHYHNGFYIVAQKLSRLSLNLKR